MPLAHARIALGALFLLLAALTGCESTPRKIPGASAQMQSLYGVQQWEAEGKIAITMGEQRESASFKWSQQRDDYVIHLFGPFGQGGTWLRRTGREVTLENAKTGVQRARSPEALMQDVMGWQVPVSNLQFWLRGLPALKPAPTQITQDTSGHLTGLQQQGWQVAYGEHQNFNGWWLPTRVTAERDDLQIRLVIKQWQMPTAHGGAL
jgi:outer membrane lipoprotein LolB